MQLILDILKSFIQPSLVVVILIFLLFINSWIFKKIKTTASAGNIAKNSISMVLAIVGLLILILSLPIDHALKGQILGLFGIIISAGIALSSTTILGNLIAGFMNNSMNRFKNGDLIKIDDFHGRVITKSIFHTEIQLEDSNFITIPNLYIANNPVKLIRKSNTVISTSVSLGYDISRIKIEKTLKKAATDIGLKDPYVYITSLGDFSVVYKIHGFLEDSSKYFTTSSQLNGRVMDFLHEANIEIVSPTFMNQRRVDDNIFISKPKQNVSDTSESKTPENLIFDQAIKSEKLETKKEYLNTIEQKIKSLKEQLKEVKDDKESKKIKASIQKNEDLKARLESSIKAQAKKNKETKS